MQTRALKQDELSKIPRAQRRPRAKPLDHYRRRYRNPRTAMVQAYLTGDYSLKVIAEHFGVHYSTVSRAVRAFESESKL